MAPKIQPVTMSATMRDTMTDRFGASGALPFSLSASFAIRERAEG
jgi:hypothetical protein